MEATLNGSAARPGIRHFHFWMAGVFVLTAFGGFTPTYWAKLVAGTFHYPPILHVHGLLLFSWTLFYFLQTGFVASGRTMRHREWGLAGISLFTLVICSILAAQIVMMRFFDAQGFGDAARRFAAVPLCGLPLMITLFSLAIANTRRPEVHKRLMYVLMASMMTPAIARVFLVLLAPAGADAGGPPPNAAVIPPTIVAFLLIAVAMIYDWRKRGRPHQVYVFGGIALLATNFLGVPFAYTGTWMSIARFLEGLGG